LKKDASGDGVPLVTAVQRLFDLTVVETVDDPGADVPAAEVVEVAGAVAAGQKKASG